MKNKFNLKRLGAFIKYMIQSDRKTFVVMPLIVLLAVIVANFFADFSFFLNRGSKFYNESMFVTAKNSMFFFDAAFVGIYLQYLPSLVSGFIGKKGQFSRYMMLPVSEAERFTSIVLLDMIVVPLIVILAVVAGSMVVAVPEMLLLDYSQDAYQMLYDKLVIDYEVVEFLATSCFFGIAAFMLGAFIWHKHAFVKTVAVAIAVQALFITSLVFFSSKSDINFSISMPAYMAIMLTLTVVMVVISWFVYKKRTVISRAY